MAPATKEKWRAPVKNERAFAHLNALSDTDAKYVIERAVMEILAMIEQEEKHPAFLRMRHDVSLQRSIQVQSAGTYVLDELFNLLAAYLVDRRCPDWVKPNAEVEMLAHSRRTKRLGLFNV